MQTKPKPQVSEDLALLEDFIYEQVSLTPFRKEELLALLERVKARM